MITSSASSTYTSLCFIAFSGMLCVKTVTLSHCAVARTRSSQTGRTNHAPVPTRRWGSRVLAAARIDAHLHMHAGLSDETYESGNSSRPS